MVSFLYEKIASDQATANLNFGVLRFTQLSSIAPIQCTDDVYSKL